MTDCSLLRLAAVQRGRSLKRSADTPPLLCIRSDLGVDLGSVGEQAPDVAGAASDAFGAAADLAGSAQSSVNDALGSVGDSLGSVGNLFNSIVGSVTSAKDQVRALRDTQWGTIKCLHVLWTVIANSFIAPLLHPGQFERRAGRWHHQLNRPGLATVNYVFTVFG